MIQSILQNEGNTMEYVFNKNGEITHQILRDKHRKIIQIYSYKRKVKPLHILELEKEWQVKHAQEN